jgi:hypothetical protein
MELKQHEQAKTTTQYWGYRELTTDELLRVGGGDDGDGDGDGDGDDGDSGTGVATDSGVVCSNDVAMGISVCVVADITCVTIGDMTECSQTPVCEADDPDYCA